MPALAVTLSIEGKCCIIIGGGAVALRRAESLLEAGAIVTVVAPRIEPALAALPIEAVTRPYQPGDLAGAFLAVIATDDRAANEAAAAEARQLNILTNRADAGDEGDLRFPAATRIGNITLAVDTGGAMPEAAAVIRDELAEALDHRWAKMIELAAPIRAAIRDAVKDRERRRALIGRLFDHEARKLFRSQGPAAYRSHCQSLLSQAFAPILA